MAMGGLERIIGLHMRLSRVMLVFAAVGAALAVHFPSTTAAAGGLNDNRPYRLGALPMGLVGQDWDTKLLEDRDDTFKQPVLRAAAAEEIGRDSPGIINKMHNGFTAPDTRETAASR
eukprot:SAG31_NODE_2519_length_5569_cov_4.141316_5_plen_117_part_00